MAILAHISDLHFGREDPKLIDGHLQSLRKIEPELIVTSGDLTQKGGGRIKSRRLILQTHRQ